MPEGTSRPDNDPANLSHPVGDAEQVRRDAVLERQMKLAREVLREQAEVLRELSKR